MTRVLQTSATTLHLRSRPPAWLLLVLWVALMAWLCWGCPSHRLEVRRVQPQLADVRVQERLFGIILSQRFVHGVTGAVVEASPYSRRRTGHSGSRATLEFNDTSRVVLETVQGPLALTGSYSVGRGIQERAADDLNRFLRGDGEDRLMLAVRNSAWIWGVAAFLAFAAVGASFGAWCECRIDRAEDSVRIIWANLPRPGRAEYRLSDVEKFLVFTTTGAAWTGRHEEPIHYTLGMRLRGGREISLTRQTSTSDSESARRIAELLEQFRTGRSDQG